MELIETILLFFQIISVKSNDNDSSNNDIDSSNNDSNMEDFMYVVLSVGFLLGVLILLYIYNVLSTYLTCRTNKSPS